MAKFVKLEDGSFINIDKIIKIEKAHYEYVFKDKPSETTNEYVVTLSGEGHEISVGMTKNDLDNILNANKETIKLSEKTAKIALNAMTNEQFSLGSEAGAVLETNDPQAMSYAQELDEQADEIMEAMEEIESISGYHLEGFGSRGESEMKARGL